MYNENDIICKWNSEMYDDNETDIDDVNFALSVIGTEPKRILEIGCGSGRFLVPMANAGHNVSGLDLDEHMLNRIAAKVSSSQSIRWSKSDVVCDAWGREFDVVLLAANFLFNITSDMDYKKNQELMIKKAADSLSQGGHIFIDYSYTLYPELWFNDPRPNLIWEGTDSEGNFGKMLLLNNTYNTETNIAKCIRRFELTLADGSSLIQEIPTEKHFVKLEQLRDWLESYGFVIENEWGDYEGNPISEDTNRAIIWARRR